MMEEDGAFDAVLWSGDDVGGDDGCFKHFGVGLLSSALPSLAVDGCFSSSCSHFSSSCICD